MKPFKAKTKNGDKWYVLNGSSLVEVDAADVPGFVARMEEAEREEAAAALAKEPSGCREEEEVHCLPSDLFGRAFRVGKLHTSDNWLD